MSFPHFLGNCLLYDIQPYYLYYKQDYSRFHLQKSALPLGRALGSSQPDRQGPFPTPDSVVSNDSIFDKMVQGKDSPYGSELL